jgi:ribonuclease P protein component
VILQEGKTNSKFAVTAGGSIGNAVKRNRAKRLIRAALKDFLENIKPGYQGMIIARKALADSTYGETRLVLESLLKEAGLINSKTDG